MRGGFKTVSDRENTQPHHKEFNLFYKAQLGIANRYSHLTILQLERIVFHSFTYEVRGGWVLLVMLSL